MVLAYKPTNNLSNKYKEPNIIKNNFPFVLDFTNYAVSATQNFEVSNNVKLTGIYYTTLALATAPSFCSVEVLLNGQRIVYSQVRGTSDHSNNESCFIALPDWVVAGGSLITIIAAGTLNLNTSFVSIIGYYT